MPKKPKEQPEDKYGRKPGDKPSIWTSIGVGIDKATSRGGKSQGVARVAVDKIARKKKTDEALREAQGEYVAVNADVKGAPSVPKKKKAK